MPLWEVKSPPWPAENFSAVDPIEVLIEYDGPLTFTFADAVGNLMLAHLCAAESNRTRYVVAPTSEKILDDLKSGARSIRGALDQPILWLVDVDNNGNTISAWAKHLDDLPEGAVPAPDVMLYRDLDPPGRLRTHPYGLLDVRGQLIGGQVMKAGHDDTFFEILVDDSTVYKGNVDDEAIPQMRQIRYGEDVHARLRIEPGKTPQTYRLISVLTGSSGAERSAESAPQK